MKKIHIITILFAAAFFMKGNAQDSIPAIREKVLSVEEFIGHERQYLQVTANKIFSEKKKVGLLSITSYAADYKSDLSKNEFQNSTLIYHTLYKGIGINSGVTFTSIEGMKNFVGLQYMFQHSTFSLIYLPSFYFTEGRKLANTALLEFKPRIKNNWSVYTRVQAHYNRDLAHKTHFRSYVYSRAGFTYKYFSFGLAHNFDQYGAEKKTKNNYGIFLSLAL
jgi:hypothetical protein